MKIIKIIIIFVFGIITSCNNYTESKFNTRKEQTISNNIDSLINSLNTIEKKEQFLINIYNKDQEARNSNQQNIILKKNDYNLKSVEYQEFIARVIYTDSINFIYIKNYLKTYGFPKFTTSSPKVISAFRAVCMHQPDYDKQLELFPYLFEAYKEKQINPDKFSFLLNNMHITKFGKSHPHARTNEENIKQLLNVLNLN